MKLKTKQLKRAVKVLGPVFNHKRVIPVTGYICIRDGRATATNASTTMSVLFEGEESVMLPYEEISELMRLEVEESVTLNGSQIKTHNDTINLGTLPSVSDFLNLPEVVTTQHTFSVNESFFDAIRLASRFMFKGEYRPEITGVGIIIGDMLTVASVDNHVSMRRNVEMIGSDKTRRIVLHPDAASYLSEFKSANISISSNLMIVSDGVTTATLPLKDQSFPDIHRVFPDTIEWTCVVDRDDLMTAINKACIVKDVVQVIDIACEGNTLTIKKQNGHQDSTTVCDAEVIIPTTQRFLADKFIKVLESLTGNSVEICFNSDPKKQAYIRSERDDDTLFLVMPCV